MESLNISGLANQTPFKEKANQHLINDWTNNNLEPQLSWKKGTTMGELAPLVRSLDPESRIDQFGRLCRNAAIYLASRIDYIDEGKVIAQDLIREFYILGTTIVDGNRPKNTPHISELASHTINAEETEQVDKFLAGEKLYQSRRNRAENEGEEETRLHTLNQYFRVLRRAAEKHPKSGNECYKISEIPSPSAIEVPGKNASELQHNVNQMYSHWTNYLHLFWEKDERDETQLANLFPLIYPDRPWFKTQALSAKFLDSQKERISETFKSPWLNLIEAIHKKGRGNLENNLGTFYSEEEEVIFKGLEEELAEMRTNSSPEKIALKEREIITQIQTIVSRIPYSSDAYSPNTILNKQKTNCAGASLMGGTLLRRFNIPYLYAVIPEHAALLPITADNNVHWVDMLTSQDQNITIDNKDLKGITTEDIIKFLKNPSPNGLQIEFLADYYPQKAGAYRLGLKQLLLAYNPLEGEITAALRNKSVEFESAGLSRESYLTILGGYRSDSHDTEFHNHMGSLLHLMGNPKQAERIYRKALGINPYFALTYAHLGSVSFDSGNISSGIQFLLKAIEVQPHQIESYQVLMDMLMRIGLPEAAEDIYQTALKIGHTYHDTNDLVEIYNNMAGLKSQMETPPTFLEKMRELSSISMRRENIPFWLSLLPAGIAGHLISKDSSIFATVSITEAIALILIGLYANRKRFK